ncbi:hypothetical protein NC653_012462 [Populus alba x Populus x berolinensis]|uniref:J domain-containing protein n=1 Tax=Populus alba x Populus x berolinensis TaxID=444605 RepID=A0AAD6QS32_9ROSI|nr:hypothetical protein NC653_012462 [Populus alba x Populus x berolinensis]
MILAVADVLLSAEKRINNHHDWYSILQISQRTHDSELIKKQYRRLALLLHPDKNRLICLLQGNYRSGGSQRPVGHKKAENLKTNVNNGVGEKMAGEVRGFPIGMPANVLNRAAAREVIQNCINVGVQMWRPSGRSAKGMSGVQQGMAGEFNGDGRAQEERKA